MKKPILCVWAVVGCATEVEGPDESRTTSEISDGYNEGSTPTTNATVRVNSCTGTLIRPDVVLAAGHCVGGRDRPPACDGPDYDWQVPGQWYSFAPCGSAVTVKFGNDAAGLYSTATSIAANETFTIDRPGSTAALAYGDSITLKSTNNFYVVAEGGGGQYVGVDRTWAGAWETFRIGGGTGPLYDGAPITLTSATGLLVRRMSAGQLRADTVSSDSAAWFTLQRIAGSGAVADSDQIALQANDGTFWTALNGGGAYILRTTASQYSLPGNRDILMLKLDTPVPSTIARPVDLVHRIPARSFGTNGVWHPYLCFGSDVCDTGDFNGDGRDDIITFTRNASGHVYVGLSSGTGFAAYLWANGACTGTQQCRVGDFNNDDRDDILLMDTSTGRGQIRLSTGSGFGSALDFGTDLCFTDEICEVGDVNGDGYDDVITFLRSVYTTGHGRVLVALHRGYYFDTPVTWHSNFCVASEECRVGDFNGDGRDDIATFLRSSAAGVGDVFVATSTGSAFGSRDLWHSYFCVGSEVCRVGDFNGDGTDDIATFLRGATNDVYVGISNGGGFGPGNVWHGSFCAANEECRAGDFDGDGRDDIASFVRDTQTDSRRGDIYVSRASAPATVDAWLTGQRFKIAGWGFIDPDTRESPSIRQYAYVDYSRHGSWYDATHAVVVKPVEGGTAISQVNDSGGPLLWWDSHKQRYVNLGATQSVNEVSEAAYTITFKPGGWLDAWVRKSLDID